MRIVDEMENKVDFDFQPNGASIKIWLCEKEVRAICERHPHHIEADINVFTGAIELLCAAFLDNLNRQIIPELRSVDAFCRNVDTLHRVVVSSVVNAFEEEQQNQLKLLGEKNEN